MYFFSVDNSEISKEKSTKYRKVMALRIVAKRMELGWSTNDLSIIAGVSRSTVLNIEDGNDVQFDLLLRVILVLGLSPLEVFFI